MRFTDAGGAAPQQAFGVTALFFSIWMQSLLKRRAFHKSSLFFLISFKVGVNFLFTVPIKST